MKKNQIVEVRFLDHSLEHKGTLKDDKGIECVVWGRVKKARGKWLTVEHWVTLDSDYDKNNEQVNILKSTITRFRVLKIRRT